MIGVLRLKRKYLRIAFSVTCGIACVLLILLLVRSYWWSDSFQWQLAESHPLDLWSSDGYCLLYTGYDLASDRNPPGSWQLSHRYINHDLEQWSWFTFSYDSYWDNFYLVLIAPHWLFALASGALAVLPWIRWRFSLHYANRYDSRCRAAGSCRLRRE
jgi:hypothetical protein